MLGWNRAAPHRISRTLATFLKRLAICLAWVVCSVVVLAEAVVGVSVVGRTSSAV